MGLYLCVWDPNDGEVDGFELGGLMDFMYLRDSISIIVGVKLAAKHFPTFLHTKIQGEGWPLADLPQLVAELSAIRKLYRQRPPTNFSHNWQRDLARELNLKPANLAECYINVDGEPLLDRMIELCELAMERNLPVLFQ